MNLDAPVRQPVMPGGARALVVGGTGLVGRECLALLAQDPQVSLVRALLRRPVGEAGLLPPALSQRMPAGRFDPVVVDFDHLERHADLFTVDWVFCALGTTIRQAGSQAAFRHVDLELPLKVARLARAQGARHCLVVSALGADAKSRVFYNRVKGELEDAVRALGFESLTLARPSLLQGERAEFRLGEAVAQKFGFLMPSRLKPVHVRQVARGLLDAAHRGRPGAEVLSNEALRAFSNQPTTP